MWNQPPDVLKKIDRYYTGKLQEHGATHRGVDWNSVESQELRFAQILKVCDSTENFTLNDYGCGYGALAEYLLARTPQVRYCGYDVSGAMIAVASQRHAGDARCRFTSDSTTLMPADYTVASGILGVKMDVSADEWERYVRETLERIAAISRKGFAFNMLTMYSDPERMRDDLYYADPHQYFDHCRTRFSRNVALLHDYGLYEFTLLVRL
jgi:SAM-dependent methyltransferase